eukprot:CAMPEP_0206489512 /NCGR_PEP_ID=MMETSP0324_2-20121206/43306_1 /ASSEMBLY_ACC=CAM_ASM_000836 /TAXON_ID=2866 /ORGANISM="Crypthecodinium cohnii, Strain Seligo" /LENGTH=226 /DNA_ID=CAMNT_0053969249 /DNA_START=103 /DNA_END=784 /DNA_ORIENTATION=+
MSAQEQAYCLDAVEEFGEEEGSNHEDYRSRLTKTRICKYWQEGDCPFGSDCRFAHGNNDLQSRPDLHKTKMCFFKDFPDGCRVANCRFAHSDAELEEAKAKMAKENGQGKAVEAGGGGDASSLSPTNDGPGASPEDSETVTESDTTNLVGFSSSYEARLGQAMETSKPLKGEDLFGSDICELVVRRVEAYARAARRSTSPLPALSKATAYREAYILKLASQDAYED